LFYPVMILFNQVGEITVCPHHKSLWQDALVL
jgi:hypothetical protein